MQEFSSTNNVPSRLDLRFPFPGKEEILIRSRGRGGLGGGRVKEKSVRKRRKLRGGTAHIKGSFSAQQMISFILTFYFLQEVGGEDEPLTLSLPRPPVGSLSSGREAAWKPGFPGDGGDGGKGGGQQAGPNPFHCSGGWRCWRRWLGFL